MIYGRDWDRLSVDEKIKEVKKQLDDDIARWHYLKENGGCDPFWPDGVNMNLKRNHILYDLKLLDELDQTTRQISMFDSISAKAASTDLVPPEVPNEYMANDRRCLYFEVG